MRNRSIIISLLVFLLIGSQSCQNRKANELEGRIHELEKSLNEKIKEAKGLNSEIVSLKQDLEISTSKYENIKIQINRGKSKAE